MLHWALGPQLHGLMQIPLTHESVKAHSELDLHPTVGPSAEITTNRQNFIHINNNKSVLVDFL